MSKALKLQEFYAHDSGVNTVSIGRHSAQVIASGGEDCKVNVWRLGKKQSIYSLAGHQTAVESVTYDRAEQTLAAGSTGGSILIWDLGTEKCVRIQGGHRSAVRCLDFHPFGSFLASGGEDCNIKIWDVKQKKSMRTYNAGSAPVTCVKHSPDGRWVVSGDADGMVKVFDLTAGRLLREFKSLRRDAVTCVDWHPNEFVLGVAHAHALHFWDMEQFELISSTPKDAAQFKSIMFNHDGSACFAATTNTLRAWTWEPLQCILNIDVPAWSNVVDMALSPEREVIAVTKQKTTLAFYVVDLPPLNLDNVVTVNDTYTGDSNNSNAQISSPSSHSSYAAAAAAADSPTYKRSQPNTTPAVSSNVTPVRPSILANPNPSFFRAHNLANGAADSAAPVSVAVPQNKATVTSSSSAVPRSTSHDALAAAPLAPVVPHDTPRSPSNVLREKRDNRDSNSQVTNEPASKPTVSRYAEAAASSVNVTPAPSSSRNTLNSDSVPVFTSSPNSTIIPANPSAPIGLNVNAFLPAAAAVNEQNEAIRVKLMNEHPLMVQILKQRLNNLRILRDLWNAGEVRQAIEALVKMNDLPTSVDFFNNAEKQLRAGVLTLDMCKDLLPILRNLLSSRFEGYVTTALKYLKLLLSSFSDTIKLNRVENEDELRQVDLQQEQRALRAQECYTTFKSIYPLLAPIAKKQQGVGVMAREVRQMLEKLLFTNQ